MRVRVCVHVCLSLPRQKAGSQEARCNMTMCHPQCKDPP